MARNRPFSKEEERRIALLEKYDLTPEAYAALDQAQNFRCRICGRHKSETRHGVLDVDHDHDTKRIRGLLCNNCNQGLGQFKDNPTSLLRAIQYLKGNL